MAKMSTNQLIQAYLNSLRLEDWEMKVKAMKKYGNMLIRRKVDISRL